MPEGCYYCDLSPDGAAGCHIHGPRIIDAYEQIAALKAEVAEMQALFDLQHTRTHIADMEWREAHPGNELVLPDLGMLIEWLRAERDVLRTERDALKDERNTIITEAQRALAEIERIDDLLEPLAPNSQAETSSEWLAEVLAAKDAEIAALQAQVTRLQTDATARLRVHADADLDAGGPK